jgi:hypothetical protein
LVDEALDQPGGCRFGRLIGAMHGVEGVSAAPGLGKLQPHEPAGGEIRSHIRFRHVAPANPGQQQSVLEAAAQDLVLAAVNWLKLPAALGGLPDFGGRIVIDVNNPIIAPPFELADLHGRLSTKVFADHVPGARVVKAFNHLPAKLLAESPAP